MEGSNLGAVFLLKRVAALGLGGGNGAGHLAAPPDGRAQHCRSSVEQLDEVELTPASEVWLDAGADAAFGRAASLAAALHAAVVSDVKRSMRTAVSAPFYPQSNSGSYLVA